jgi:hypothetical protein
MSSHLGLIEAVMLELFVMGIGLRELYVLRKDGKKTDLEKRDEEAKRASQDNHDQAEK